MSTPSAKHFVALDFYRFIAASGVCLSHLGTYLSPHAIPVGTNWYLFVDFFFILSGFVIASGYAERCQTIRDIQDFLRRRLARIYPLHLLTLSVMIALVVLWKWRGGTIDPETHSFYDIPAQLLLVNAWSPTSIPSWNLPQWSISAEWAMYLLFPLLIWGVRQLGVWVLVIIALISYAADEYAFSQGVGFFGPIRAVPTFVLGVALWLSFGRLKRSGTMMWLGFCLFFGTVAAMDHLSKPWILVGFSLSIVLSANRDKHILNADIFKFLGNASYSVYMLHALVFSIMFNLVWKRLFEAAPSSVAGIAAYAIVVTLAAASYRFFENPMRAFLSGRRLH